MKFNDFLDVLVEDFQPGLMIKVGDEVYTISDDDFDYLNRFSVKGLVTDDVIDRRKNLREMDLTVKTIHSAWFKKDFVVIETKNK